MIFQKCNGPDMFSWIRHRVTEAWALPSALLVFSMEPWSTSSLQWSMTKSLASPVCDRSGVSQWIYCASVCHLLCAINLGLLLAQTSLMLLMFTEACCWLLSPYAGIIRWNGVLPGFEVIHLHFSKGGHDSWTMVLNFLVLKVSFRGLFSGSSPSPRRLPTAIHLY